MTFPRWLKRLITTHHLTIQTTTKSTKSLKQLVIIVDNTGGGLTIVHRKPPLVCLVLCQCICTIHLKYYAEIHICMDLNMHISIHCMSYTVVSDYVALDSLNSCNMN